MSTEENNDDWLQDLPSTLPPIGGLDPSKKRSTAPAKKKSPPQTQPLGTAVPAARMIDRPQPEPSADHQLKLVDPLDIADDEDEMDLPPLTNWQEQVMHRFERDVMSGVMLSDAYIDEPVASKTPKKSEFLREVRLFAASCFLQANSKFIDVERPEITLSAYEIFRKLTQKIYQRYADEIKAQWISEKSIRDICEGVVDGLNADPRFAFGVFSGRRYLLPGNGSPRLYRDGYWDINLWKEPAYRGAVLGGRAARSSMQALQAFLDFAIPDAGDQTMLLDWISWSLRHEASKPSWAIFLFSEQKGTGKSTLLALVRKLFGEENCSEQNGIEGITGRFPGDILSKKVITIEEVKLTSFSSAGNTLKEYITGQTVSVERKNENERVRIPLRACIMLTSNHRPTWLEGGERRYYIIEVAHEGHALGTKREDFAELVSELNKVMADPVRLKRLYLELRHRTLSADFSPHVIRHRNKLMRELGEDDVNETDAVLEDLLSTYRVHLIPSEEQHLLVKHLRLKTEQDLRSRLTRLGFVAQRRWVKDAQKRVWVRKDLPIENGCLYAPALSADLKLAVEMGYVWWPLQQVELGWRRLVRLHLRPETAKQPYSALMQTVTEELLCDPYRSEGHFTEETGPYLDPKTKKPYGGGDQSLQEDLRWLFPEDEVDIPF